MLTIVDEAHRLTERVNYGGDSDRDREYEALRAIAHASTALLLLSATPVRSNEDAFLGLLHLLDPANYPLTDLDGFRRRVEMRDDLAQAMSAISAETPLRYLDEPLTQISRPAGRRPGRRGPRRRGPAAHRGQGGGGGQGERKPPAHLSLRDLPTAPAHGAQSPLHRGQEGVSRPRPRTGASVADPGSR